jgi:hypothetical protein
VNSKAASIFLGFNSQSTRFTSLFIAFFYSFSFRFIEVVESLVKESCFAGANGAGETAQRISATAGDAALVQD